MNRNRALLVTTLATATLCLSVMAAADGLDRDSDTQNKAIRVDKMPTMQFLRGVLEKDMRGNWKIGNYMLSMRRKAFLSMEGQGAESAELREGYHAILMGHGYGENFIVFSGIVQNPDYTNPGGVDEENVVWSESDPNVGLGEGPE
jgi:hypothetical protein